MQMKQDDLRPFVVEFGKRLKVNSALTAKKRWGRKLREVGGREKEGKKRAKRETFLPGPDCRRSLVTFFLGLLGVWKVDNGRRATHGRATGEN